MLHEAVPAIGPTAAVLGALVDHRFFADKVRREDELAVRQPSVGYDPRIGIDFER